MRHGTRLTDLVIAGAADYARQTRDRSLPANATVEQCEAYWLGWTSAAADELRQLVLKARDAAREVRE
jgi:hypothetical protein